MFFLRSFLNIKYTPQVINKTGNSITPNVVDITETFDNSRKALGSSPEPIFFETNKSLNKGHRRASYVANDIPIIIPPIPIVMARVNNEALHPLKNPIMKGGITKTPKIMYCSASMLNMYVIIPLISFM